MEEELNIKKFIELLKFVDTYQRILNDEDFIELSSIRTDFSEGMDIINNVDEFIKKHS